MNLTSEQTNILDKAFDNVVNYNGSIMFDRKYDNYVLYLDTLYMFEYWCDKGNIDMAINELEKYFALYFPLGDILEYQKIKELVNKRLGYEYHI